MESINIQRPELGLQISSTQEEDMIMLQLSDTLNFSRIVELITIENERLDIWTDEPLNRILIFPDMINKDEAIACITDAIDKYEQEITLL